MADATSCEITTLTPKITEDEEPYLLVHLESDNLTVEVERRLLVALHKEIKDLRSSLTERCPATKAAPAPKPTSEIFRIMWR
jgi:hypothetical protein